MEALALDGGLPPALPEAEEKATAQHAQQQQQLRRVQALVEVLLAPGQQLVAETRVCRAAKIQSRPVAPIFLAAQQNASRELHINAKKCEDILEDLSHTRTRYLGATTSEAWQSLGYADVERQSLIPISAICRK